MSGEDKAHTSVLLPGARVVLFTRDSETRDAFMALEKDWRFARVRLEVRDGDVETASAAYTGHASPDLILVQTDTIDEGFTARLEALGAHCADDTAAIVIGPVNDVNLYRRLVGMGVSDYLVRPVAAAVLADDIAETLLEKFGAAGSRLIGVMGAKGGVGATTLAQALAWGLADRLNQKTFLLDAAGGWSTLGVGMNFEPTTTLAEAARAAVEKNHDSLTRMMFTAGERLTVLSSGGDVMLDDVADGASYEALIDHLMLTYPVVVADLSAAPSYLKRTVLRKANEIMLVTAPTLPSVRATRTLVQEIGDLRGGAAEQVDIIVNMTGFARAEVPKAQIEEGLERKPSTYIPFDPGLFVALESEARRITEDKAGQAVVEKILPFARKVLVRAGGEDDGQGGTPQDNRKGGGIGQIISRLKTKS